MAKKRGGKKALALGKMELHRVAHYTFFVGLLIAVIAGLFRNVFAPEVLVTTLVILGFIVGLFNFKFRRVRVNIEHPLIH